MPGLDSALLSEPSGILAPAACHLLLTAALYAWLTVERAANVWRRRGLYSDLVTPGGDQGRAARIAANLSNQFEAPTVFHPLVLALWATGMASELDLALAWAFVIGRLAHTMVQTLTTNVPLRGMVFSINFVALSGLWGNFFLRVLGV